MEGKDVWGTIYFDEKFIPITNDIIPGIRDWYLVSNYGKVYHKYAGRMLSYSVYYGNGNKDKPYYSVGLVTENGLISVRVHRLVMACFYPELGGIKQKMDINHKNGVTNDNYISYNDYNRGNLEWLSHQDNIIHAYETGLQKVGEEHSTAKISNEIANKVIELLLENKYTSKEICSIINNSILTTHMVDDIRKKHCWKHLTKDIQFYQRPGRLFTDEEMNNFCKYFEANSPKPENITVNDFCRQALIYYGFEPSSRYLEILRKLFTKKQYKNIVSKYNF